jgi:1-acyl-sn-glycerol-3-phosphate acyltransferase
VTVLPDPTFILKRELTWIPLFGWFLGRGRMVPIDRSRGSRAIPEMNRRAAEAMAEGRQLIIFPEGTRRPPGAAPAYKAGTAHLYSRLEVSCLPVAVNSGLFWPRRSVLRRPGTAVIAFLEPIPPGMLRDAFAALVEQRIETAANALLAEGRAELGEAGAARAEPAATDARPLPSPAGEGAGGGGRDAG